MALSPNINNREFDKFVLDENGDTAVRVEGTLVVSEGIAADILNAADKIETITTADFGTVKERVTLITYTAASVGIQVLNKTFSYTLVSGKYRLDQIVWTLV
jgi:hypothetical protein